MKFPSQNNLSITTIGPNRYEPKSVLDIRQSPPSSLTNNSLFSSEEKLPVENFEHGMNTQIEEWDSDSLMRELGLYDDSNKSVYPIDLPDQLSPFFHTDFETLNTNLTQNLNQNQNQNLFDLMTQHEDEYDFDYKDELIQLAECFETQSFQLAQVTLARLNRRLRSPNGNPFQRASFYFKEALQSLFNGTTRSFISSTSYEIVQTIKAYNMFSTVSPIPMFSSFTANQAILDATDGAVIIHVIDFDIGFGGQWSSFLKSVAEKTGNPPGIRITAVVPEHYELESRLIKDNLHQFSKDLNIRFDIDFVSIRVFEMLSFKSVKFINGEKTAVVLSPTIFQHVGSGFVQDLRRVSPNVVVCVDGELNSREGSSFFSKRVVDGLGLYTTILESLEAGSVDGEGMRGIEMFVLLPKIIAAVEEGGRNVGPWREVVIRGGMRPVRMSQFADFQAECLVRRVQVRGFHVVKSQAEMMLCWHDRPLVATSVWTF